jgi:hypothetical protein
VAAVVVSATVLALPMGYFGAASIVAPLLPYHPMKLRERRHRRDTWKRWTIAVISPYMLIAPASLVLLAPGFLVFYLMGRDEPAPILAVLLITAWTWIFRRLMINWTLALTARRLPALREFLADPTRG